MPCRWTRGHSEAVAALAEAAGSQLGVDAEGCTLLRHAGYLHDLGRVAIATSIWEAERPLTEGERERVRLHAYYTERILARPASLAPVAAVASLAHERTDGSGYHRRIPTNAIPLTARILAAADVYAALVANRPHRAALTPAGAAQMLSDEASAGRLDARAVSAVLAAAGHATSERRAVALPNGLSSREAEVLALVAVGMTNKEVATRLRISDRTVGHHLQHVYDKLGVSTRAAAALFAQQRGLVAEGATPHQG
jgi:HD-GYP domain-containing protein (c-di-GMP phosphodiesterase class II)